MTRRDFGSIRRLPSGRWQARFRDPTGHTHTKTFASRGDASRYLATARVDIDRGDWFDPTAGQQTLEAFATSWLATRRVRGRPITPRTRERYEGVLRTHLIPALGNVPLRDLDPGRIRRWYTELNGRGKPGPATVAKCYRLLHAICATAVVEGEMPRNPCMIPGASAESSPERPIATIQQVFALAEAVGERWRALVLLATFCGLRFGELAALTRDHLDLDNATVTVVEDLDELSGRLQRGEVKSPASRRSVAIPAVILPDLERHLAAYAAPGHRGLVFVGAKRGQLRRGNFRRSVWVPAVESVGIPSLRFHDLRHTGNTLAAATGASTRELMTRMGHASSRAALIYQHATRDRDAAIAAALSDLVTGASDTDKPGAVPLLRPRDTADTD
jgi:integrase